MNTGPRFKPLPILAIIAVNIILIKLKAVASVPDVVYTLLVIVDAAAICVYAYAFYVLSVIKAQNDDMIAFATGIRPPR